MSNWHTRDGDDFGNGFTVLFHIPIPAGANNRAGMSYRTAIVQANLNTTVMSIGSSAGQMTAAEKAVLDAGGIVEVSRVVYSQPSETIQQLISRLDAMFTALTSEVQAKLQNRLTYWGGTSVS